MNRELFYKNNGVKYRVLLGVLVGLFFVVHVHANEPTVVETIIETEQGTAVTTEVQQEPKEIIETIIESDDENNEKISHYTFPSSQESGIHQDMQTTENITGEYFSGEQPSTDTTVAMIYSQTGDAGYQTGDAGYQTGSEEHILYIPILTETILEGQGVTIATGLNAGVFSGDAGATGEAAIFMPAIIFPKQHSFVQDSKGRIDPTTIQSYNYETSDMTYCSAIARNNLGWITGMPEKKGLSLTGDSVAKGDAIALIQQGLHDEIFLDMLAGRSLTGDIRYDPTINIDDIVNKFTSIIQEGENTVFDVYIYDEEQYYRNGSKDVNAGHRVVVFWGNDGFLYVLDPVRTGVLEPVSLADYLRGFVTPTEKIYLYIYGYRPYKEDNGKTSTELYDNTLSLCQTLFSGQTCPSYITENINITIGDREVSVNAKRDMKGHIREIILLDDIVVHNQELGISMTIPKDGKIFAPTTGNNDGYVSGSELSDVSATVHSDISNDAIMNVSDETDADINAINDDVDNQSDNEQNIGVTGELSDPLAGQDSIASLEFLLEVGAGTGIVSKETPSASKEIAIATQATEQELNEVSDPNEPDELTDGQSDDAHEETNNETDTLIGNTLFTFGLAEQHLIFTKPVVITVDAPDKKDGELVYMQVKHVGDDLFGSVGLSVDSSTLCLPDGTTTVPGDVAEVVRGKAVFYTCGASAFSLGYVPAIVLPNAQVSAIARQSDGKMLIGGSFTTVGGVTRNYIARLNEDKSLDTTFNPNANNAVKAIAIQEDGKIVIGGTFTTVGGTARNRIARLNEDGSLDTTFNPNASNTVNTIVVQEDGEILIGGTFTTVGGTSRNRIARLLTGGGIDTTFNPNASNTVNTIVVQEDGEILIGGTFTTVGGTSRRRIARLHDDGSLDATFNPNSNNTVNTVAVQEDGEILIGGTFTKVGGTSRNRIARLLTGGGIDTTFNPNSNNTVNTVAVQEDGKIVMGGTFTTVGGIARNCIARLHDDGSLDTTFNPNANNTVNTIVVQSGGKLLIGGNFTTINAISQPYFSMMDDAVHGTVYNARPNNPVNNVLSQSDKKIVIGGTFTTVGGASRNRIARLNVDGSLDTTFDVSSGSINSNLNVVAIQEDDKILIGGSFTTVFGHARNRIVRLLTGGGVDTTFNPNLNNTVRSIAVQEDDKILVGGVFTTVGGTAHNRMARLNTDGSLDTTFNPNPDANVHAIAVQEDGKILIGGTFTTVGGTARNRIARLNTDGSLDTTFNPNVDSTVFTIVVQEDGKILIGGGFTTVGGTAHNYIARLNTDGSLDTTFDPGVDGGVTKIRILNDDIFVAGYFTQVGGFPIRTIAKLSMDGSVDTMLNPTLLSTGTYVNDMTLDGSGNLVFGGGFTTVNGSTTNPYLAWIGLTLSSDNMALWLRSDAGLNCMTHNCNITDWSDQSPNARDGTTTLGSTGYVKYDSGTMVNFNPTVNLSNAQIDFSNSGILNNFMVFYIMSGDDTSPGIVLFEDASTSMRFGQWNNTKKYGFTRYSIADYVSSLSTQRNTWQILRYNSANTTTMDLSVQTPTTILSQTGWSIGAVSNLSLAKFSSTVTSAIGHFNIAEMMVYAGQLSPSNLDKVVSYLSIKYGFTVDQSGSGGKNYTLSDGTISRSASSGGSYNKNIAGIMRDDGFSLIQRKSQSISDNSDIIGEITGAITNMQGVVRANDGADKSSWTTTELDTDIMANRISRERKFQRVGTSTGDLIINMPSSGVPSYTPLPAEELVMLLDDDNDFSTDSAIITGTILSGQYEFIANIPDGYYITFGYKKGISGSLCIDAPSSFSLGTITASSTIQTVETESDYFVVDDQKGLLSGYYTTIALSGAAPGLQRKASPVTTISGTANTGVVLDAPMTTYHTPGGAETLIKRDPGINSGILGVYGTKITITLDIPAYTQPGVYTGNITYTLYQN